jgi:hypothetical protein
MLAAPRYPVPPRDFAVVVAMRQVRLGGVMAFAEMDSEEHQVEARPVAGGPRSRREAPAGSGSGPETGPGGSP